VLSHRKKKEGVTLKKKLGRPTKMTEATVNKLEEAFALGCTDAEACLYADISKQSLYNYQEKNPEFVERKELLKQKPVLQARKSVAGDLEGDSNLALKYLERKKKDEFSVRQIVAVESPLDRISIEQLMGGIRALIAQASPEQLKEIGITRLEARQLLEHTEPLLRIEDAQKDD
jgi:hypothetical protein